MKKILSKIFICILIIFIFACKKKNFFEKSEIIIPKNQTEAQSLSIIVKDDKNGLTIFDGGRIEDADYLKSIIIENGGKVNYWFLTHIHDDHIGALYKILNDKMYDIEIKNLCYNFADFDWYYSKMGNDAGILTLFENALSKYISDIPEDKKSSHFINVQKKLAQGENFTNGNISVTVLNNMYKLDSDPINNTSIVYKIDIEDKSMIILGDLGYAGSTKLLSDQTAMNLHSDILVMSHHGQNGGSENLYIVIDPKIVIWPTTKRIYENSDNQYPDVDNFKEIFSYMNVKEQYVTFDETHIIK